MSSAEYFLCKKSVLLSDDPVITRDDKTNTVYYLRPFTGESKASQKIDRAHRTRTTTMKSQIPPTPLDANTMAVALLKEKKTAEALSCFRQGLRMLNSKTDVAETICGQTSECAQQCSVYRSSKRRRLTPVGDEGSIHTVDAPAIKNRDMEMSPDNMFVLFNRAIILSPSARVDKAATESVLLYNMGFAYHREGVERGCSALLRKALQGYETAGRVLRKSPAGSDLVMFALVNNMGHIHSHFFEKQAADCCQRCLSLNISTYAHILSKYDLAFFTMNFFKTDMLQWAPAA
jgi:hypothetical protein